MAEIKTDVQGIFSSIAKRYDLLNSILTLNIDKVWRKKAIKLGKIKKNNKVLDLCCGTGRMIDYECKAVGKSTSVIGIDFSQEMLNVAKKRLEYLSKDYKFDLIKGSILKLPFEDNTFDCITIAFGLRNIKDTNKALSEMYRVLKPDGKAICLELSKPNISILNLIYNIYFNNVLPVIGYIGTGDKKAYYYLRDSVNNFMTKDQLKQQFQNNKFKSNGYKSLTFGIASIHYGIK
ncbi:bifunctional demethylmenaquinone methyltransferase/2-methoxy-6-polyprenyl-1,4-benzoquinol methylase UbiE [Clostridium sp. 19966]|uniref:bifunctional demethylmenaquinone methyltransferase/2-methoxy-6-polyprenyl-1,4-benzoquinol methylase UbiE n=1 Tax=Clostridium sp. 19966 TaxID=2768166 RepID=UPI0028E020B6|nr:bifunctional demethylmenaquinone methyltransferase/2-methoxy-6-polyprenyl-1,4-benzoquinol methylase UbiE [Clostridium sp. 19966]MDT8718625.1 bifunctional demethylmenaquinone methyltransferase/2-methoxy-6-polyprenyl-1,4-benzoquinol methylase UbiE [Clostridium sp. 19966]